MHMPFKIPEFLIISCLCLVTSCASGGAIGRSGVDTNSFRGFIASITKKMQPGADGIDSAYVPFDLPMVSGEFTLSEQGQIRGVAFSYRLPGERCLPRNVVIKAFFDNGYVEEKLLQSGTNEYIPGQLLSFLKQTLSGTIPVSVGFSGSSNFNCAATVIFNRMYPHRESRDTKPKT